MEYLDFRNENIEDKYLKIIDELLKDNIKEPVIRKLLDQGGGVIKMEMVELLKNNDFKEMEYYEQSKNLFNNHVPVAWAKLIFKVINEYQTDKKNICSYIKEICKAFNYNIGVDKVENVLNHSATPAEIHSMIEGELEEENVNNKIKETIEDIPYILNKQQEAREAGIKIYKDELDKCKKQLDNLNKELDKQREEIAFYRKKYSDNNSKVIEYKYKIQFLEDKIKKMNVVQDKAVQQENEQMEIDSISNLLDQKVCSLFETKINSLNKLIANSFSKIRDEVSNIKSDSNVSLDEVEEKYVSILKKLEVIENTAISTDSNDSNSYINDEKIDDELGNAIDSQINELSSEAFNDDAANENEAFNEELQEELQVKAEEDYESIVENADSIGGEQEEVENFETEKNSDVDLKTAVNCEASDILQGNILTSSKKDAQENEKINFITKFRFSLLSYKKQIEFITGIMVNKKFSINTIRNIKNVMLDETVTPKSILELLNDGMSEEDINSLFNKKAGE